MGDKSVDTVSNAGKLLVAIAADCDPDRPEYGGAGYDSRLLIWRNIEEAIPVAERICAEAGREQGGFRVTWCVRADTQIAELYDDAGWVCRNFGSTWRRLAAAGHEIAWHPHLWRWDIENRYWYQECNDVEWIHECMHKGYYAMVEAMGDSPRSVRMGWNFQNDLTMQIADSLGLEADLSGIPGESCLPHGDKYGGEAQGAYNWEVTPEQPYHPSVADFRRPVVGRESALNILEIPLTPTRSAMICGMVKLRGMVRRRGKRSRHRGWRHALRITARPVLFRGVIMRALRAAAGRGSIGVLAASFHPDELMVLPGTERQLYSAENLAANLRALVQMAESRGIELVPVKANMIRQQLDVGGVGSAGAGEC
jgi:hypothetical protein